MISWSKPLDKDRSKMEGYFEDDLDVWLSCLMGFSDVCDKV